MPRTAQYNRDQALSAAVSLFWQRGYHATSLKAVEHALNMRPGSLYSAFGNKESLFLEALEHYTRNMAEDLERHIEQKGKVLDGIHSYLGWLLLDEGREQAASPACMLVKTLLESTDNTPVLREKSVALLGEMERRLTDALERAAEAGELKPSVDCQRLARLLQTQIMGIRAFAHTGADQVALRALLDDIKTLLSPYQPAH